MRTSPKSAFVWDNVDSSYYRTEAERCRWLALRADPSTASILAELAAGYDAKAAAIESEEPAEPLPRRQAGAMR